MRYEEVQADKQMAYGLQMKELDIKVQTLESKWAAWLRLPGLILRLPLLVILGVGYIVHAVKGTEPSDNFWNLLK